MASTEAGAAAVTAGGGTSRRGRPARHNFSLLLRALAALAPVSAPADSPSPADPDNATQVGRGAAIYADACASCHGARLEGQPDWRSLQPNGTLPAPPHGPEGHSWHHSDGLLFRYTRLGGAEALKDIPGVRSAMPGFRDTLSDQDIWDVLAFIKAHWPEQMRDYQHAASENDK